MHRPDDLNVYVPLLQRAAGAAYFFRKMRGAAVPSSALMAPMTQRFVDAIKSFAARNGIDLGMAAARLRAALGELETLELGKRAATVAKDASSGRAGWRVVSTFRQVAGFFAALIADSEVIAGTCVGFAGVHGIQNVEFVTSFNWLSFRGNPNQTFREEWGTLVAIPAVVEDYFEETVQRFAVGEGGAGNPS